MNGLSFNFCPFAYPVVYFLHILPELPGAWESKQEYNPYGSRRMQSTCICSADLEGLGGGGRRMLEALKNFKRLTPNTIWSGCEMPSDN